MAMFKWSGMYINPGDVVSITTGTDSRQDYPFSMTVGLRNGREFKTNYAKASARDLDAGRLADCVGRIQPEPVTSYEMELIVNRLKDTIRRDIKNLRQELKKEE